MKAVLEKGIITQALQETIAVIPSRTTLPVLSTILLDARDNTLHLTATDLEICVKKTIPAEISQPGKVTVPGKKLYDILREIPSGEIVLEESKGLGMTIRGRRSFFKLFGFSPDEYPEIPEVEGRSLGISSSILQEMITRTYFACSREETRYTLNGVLFDFRAESLRLVASDGRRLAFFQKALKSNLEGKYIVPQKAVAELLRMIELRDKEEIRIKFSSNNNQVGFYSNNTELITRLIEGEFPNYEEVIPPQSQNKLKLKRDDFYQAVKRVSLLTTSDSIAIKLEVYKDKLVISKITPELGEAQEEMPIQYRGEELVVGFNPQYLMDVLRHLEEEEIEFELNGADKAGVIRLGSEYIYLVLPMQLI